MNKHKIIVYLQSVIAIPILAVAVPFAGIDSIPSTTIVNNIPVQENSVIITHEEVLRQEKADSIDKFFESYDAPLSGHGMKFVTEAEEHGLDYRLLPAIAMRESTGGIHACKNVANSVFGYGSCKIGFISIDKSIELVAESLGGDNPKTAHHYDGKTTIQILKKYNSIIPNYSGQVVKIMNKISNDGEKII